MAAVRHAPSGPAQAAAQAAAQPTAPQAGRRRRRSSRRHVAAPWWFLIPALAFYLFVVLIPGARGAYFAFTNWNGLSRVQQFVGLANFRAILHDPAASGAIEHTLFIAVAVTIAQNVAGLLLALGVTSRIKSRNALRVLFFAPSVVAPVATGYLWQYLLSPAGAVNTLLHGVGLGFLQQDWLGDPSLVLWSIATVIVWQFAGYSMVIFIAGLQSIPGDVLEAAVVDGTNPWQRFWHVTFPLLRPAVVINLMLSVIGGLKLFDQVWVMTSGGPGDASQTMSTLIYQNAFQFGEYGYSVAMALILTMFVAILSGAQYRLLFARRGLR